MSDDGRGTIWVAVIGLVGTAGVAIVSGWYLVKSTALQIEKDVRVVEVSAIEKREHLIREKSEALFGELSELTSFLDANDRFEVRKAKEYVARARKAAFALSVYADPELSVRALTLVESLNSALVSIEPRALLELVESSRQLRVSFEKQIVALETKKGQITQQSQSASGTGPSPTVDLSAMAGGVSGEMGKGMKDIFLLLVGAAIALLSSWVVARIERETSASNELFNRRLSSLNDIWIAFLAVKDVYSLKIQMGHESWAKSHKKEAEEKLNSFRRLVDSSQVVLPKTIIGKLRDIDSYMYELLWSEKQKPSEYVTAINDRLDTLSDEANKYLKKRTHAIELHFRT